MIILLVVFLNSNFLLLLRGLLKILHQLCLQSDFWWFKNLSIFVPCSVLSCSSVRIVLIVKHWCCLLCIRVLNHSKASMCIPLRAIDLLNRSWYSDAWLFFLNGCSILHLIFCQLFCFFIRFEDKRFREHSRFFQVMIVYGRHWVEIVERVSWAAFCLQYERLPWLVILIEGNCLFTDRIEQERAFQCALVLYKVFCWLYDLVMCPTWRVHLFLFPC